MNARVTVVIPNWNGRSLLPLCLSSLRQQSFRDFETLVVDNGSTDGSRELLARDFPEVRILSLGKNRGFSAAVNAGIRASEAGYVALLNNDTEQDPEWLSSLVRDADAHPEAGFFACKLLNAEHREARPDPRLDSRIQSFEMAFRMQVEAAEAGFAHLHAIGIGI